MLQAAKVELLSKGTTQAEAIVGRMNKGTVRDTVAGDPILLSWGNHLMAPKGRTKCKNVSQKLRTMARCLICLREKYSEKHNWSDLKPEHFKDFKDYADLVGHHYFAKKDSQPRYEIPAAAKTFGNCLSKLVENAWCFIMMEEASTTEQEEEKRFRTRRDRFWNRSVSGIIGTGEFRLQRTKVGWKSPRFGELKSISYIPLYACTTIYHYPI